MATITSLGTASGLDLQGILDKLAIADQQPLTAIAKKEAVFQSQLSAYGSLKGALSALQTAAQTLAAKTAYTNTSATLTDTSVLSASVTNGASISNYSISVGQLAQAQVLRSNTNFAAISDTFNTGAIAISIGGAAAQSITIDSSNNTLSGIRDAINTAGLGVSASIVNDGTTNRLLLSATATGLTAGAISVAVTDAGTGGSNALSTLDSSSLVSIVNPQDARFSVNGLAITRSSNTVPDVITGVTLNLTKAGTLALPLTTQLNVTRNTAATQASIATFVSAYNAAVTQIATLSAYDATNKSASVLTGDSTLRSIGNRLSTLIGTAVSGLTGNISRLSDIGIALQKDGTLLIDAAKLPTALNDSSKDVTGLFSTTTSGNQGLAVRINTALEGITGSSGLITSRTDGITKSIKNLDNQSAALSLRISKIEATYRAQFAALDKTIGSLRTTSSFLTQQLDYIKAIATGVSGTSSKSN